MDNNKVTSFLVFLIICLTIGCIVLNIRLYNEKEKQIKEIYDLVTKDNRLMHEANIRDSIATRTKDSLSFLLSARLQKITINQFYYDSSNKAIANFNTADTDSLYSKSKWAAYKTYGYLLVNN